MNNKSPTQFIRFAASIALAAFLFTQAFVQTTQAQSAIRPIIFPVIGTVNYSNDFGAPRDGGARSHEGNDIMGKKMMPLVAAVNGRIRSVTFPEATWGYMVVLEDEEGYTYHYIHMNNDTPGTDDGKGGGLNAYAVDVRAGNPVVAGQLLGWMGDSGNAESTSAHLHFEIRRDGSPINPYESLRAARKITTPASYGALPDEILPYGNFTGGASLVVGNLDADSGHEIVTGAGPGGGPNVKVMEKDGTAFASFFAYLQTFRGGVDVATGDVDGDGLGEIITAPGFGGGPNVKIFKLDGTLIHSFMAYSPKFTGGVNVTAADVDGDGKVEVITAPGKGGGPHVRIFKPTGEEVRGFFAYDQGFRGGIDVAAYKAVGEVSATIVTAPGTGGGPHIKVFDGSGNFQSEFLAYDATHNGGVRVSIGNVRTNSNAPEIMTGPILGGPHLRLFRLDGSNVDDDTEFEPWWIGFWDVAAFDGETYVSTGPNTKRRTSVREAEL